MREKQQRVFPEHERLWVFLMLIFVGGYFGVFTYSIRGGVFSNAQTGNFVLFAIAAGEGAWFRALYYLIPMSAYLLGTILSELAVDSVRRRLFIRWDTFLILLETAVVALLGFIPERAPHQITQLIISFICSMQYNTFRQAQDIPMATTFCTNHLRQAGVAAAGAIRRRGQGDDKKRLFSHLAMMLMFVAGGISAAILCRRFLGKAIWAALIPLGIVGTDLLCADLREGREN